MLYQLTSYFKFLFKSSNAHGVHSPFVYDLITKCFYDTTKFEAYKLLQRHRQSLLTDERSIEIEDFGKGSRVFKNNTRSVAKIAKHAGIPHKRQRLLYRITRYFSSATTVELGTSVGLATAALALGNQEGKVTTVEGCQATSEVAASFFRKFDLNNIELHTSTFDEFFDSKKQSKFDLVYIDGNHSKENTLTYFRRMLTCIHNDSVLIFDDIYWSPEMTEAWKEIIAHSQVTVSIDSFYWGLIFFRKEQPKQHFRIRL